MPCRVLRAVAAVAFLCALFSVPASALEVPARPQGYVTDRASLLSPDMRRQLEQALRSYEAQTGNQIVVATFPSLEQESLEDFSIRLAERWKVGQAGKDNGVILLIFRAEQLVRIEVGYGLEGALPDALAGSIIQREIAPHFKQGRYDEGVLRGVRAILQAVEGEYTADPFARQGAAQRQLTPEQMAAIQRQNVAFLGFLLIAVVGLFIADLFRYFRYRNDHSLYRDRYSFWEWFFRFALLLAVLSIIFRMLFYAMLFSRGGYGGRGGGFSGGGGSFGGGGAGGRW